MDSGRSKLILYGSCGVAAFALLLMIISVGVPNWTIDNESNSVGLFRKCYGSQAGKYNQQEGCINENQTTSGGLAVFGLLLLSFAVITGIAGTFMGKSIVLYVALGLLYFSSMFIMSAYATWGVYSRDPTIFAFPVAASSDARHQGMGPGYNVCVAAHYFLWTAMTAFAFAVGMICSKDSTSG